MKMNLIDEGEDTQFITQTRKKEIKEPDFNKDRDRANFRNYINTMSLEHTHKEAITCMIDL